MVSRFFHSLLHRSAAVLLALAPGLAHSYPLDGVENTGITRLLHQRAIQEGTLQGRKRPSGKLLPRQGVDLRLLDRPDFQLPKPDRTLTKVVQGMLGKHHGRYGLALLDLSDKDNPRYAVWTGAQRQNPGSVGKVLVALAVFQALADIYPEDIDARKRVLRESQIVADEFSVYDHHTIRFLIRLAKYSSAIRSMWVIPRPCGPIWIG
jgi:hypothetical protein